MRDSLGQDLWYPGMPTVAEPWQQTPEASQDITDVDAASFGSWWDRFTTIWPDFLNLRGEIQTHQERWQSLASDAYAAGDVEGMRAYQANVRALDSVEAERQSVEDAVTRFRDTWQALKDYLAGLGRWFGMQGLGGLGLPPLVLAIGIPALIAAIAWVVTSYMSIRADLEFDRQALESAEAGTITPEQARAMIAARTGPGLLSLTTGGLGTPLLLVGGGVLLLWFLGRR